MYSEQFEVCVNKATIRQVVTELENQVDDLIQVIDVLQNILDRSEAEELMDIA